MFRPHQTIPFLWWVKASHFHPFMRFAEVEREKVRPKGANMWLQSFILKRRGEGWWALRAFDSRSAVFSTSRQCTSCCCRVAQFLKLLWFTDFEGFFFSDTALCAEKIQKKQQIPWKTNKKNDASMEPAQFWRGGRNTAVTCKVLLPSDVKNQVIKIKLTGNQNHQKSSLYFSRFWRVDWKARHSIGANHGQSDLRFRVCDLQTTSCLECFRFTRRHTISSTSFRPRRGLETTCDFLFSRCRLNLDPAALLAFCVKSNN